MAGFGLPVDLEEISVTVGYVFKAQYFLPYNVSQLNPFRDEISKKLRRNTDYNYDKNVEHSFENVIEVETNPLADTLDDVQMRGKIRWAIYHAVENYAKSMGYNGRECMLQAICETAAVPFTFSNGILGELFHIIMT